jgi:hypothetical protein
MPAGGGARRGLNSLHRRGQAMTPRINRDRLLGRLETFNRIGTLPGGGNCRLAHYLCDRVPPESWSLYSTLPEAARPRSQRAAQRPTQRH